MKLDRNGRKSWDENIIHYTAHQAVRVEVYMSEQQATLKTSYIQCF